MNTGEALWKTCVENPEDSTARLIFGDWSEEQDRYIQARQVRCGECFVFGGDGDYSSGGGSGDGGANKYKLSQGYIMESYRLYIVCSPGGYYPYVRIGWCEVQDGWVILHNARIIKRFGNLAHLTKMSVEGPIVTTQLLEPSKMPSGLAVGMVTRFEECDPKAWEKECPKPEGW